MTSTQTHTLVALDADLVYDVRGPLPASGGRPALLMIGQPMTADGFTALAAHFRDRTVVTYDPRGLGRSVRRDGRSDQTPQQQAADLHGLIEALGAGPTDNNSALRKVILGGTPGARTLRVPAVHGLDG